MTLEWFAYFALAMLGGSATSKGLAPTIVYAVMLLTMYPVLDYGLEAAALYVVAVAVSNLRA